MEGLELALAEARRLHSEQLARAAAALEAEAASQARLQRSEEAAARDQRDAARTIAALERDVQALTRLAGAESAAAAAAAPGGAPSPAVAAAVAALPPDRVDALRREVTTQHTALGALSEALAIAEARVRELERYADLARDAGVAD